MKRANLRLTLVSSAVAVALLALVYGLDPHRPSASAIGSKDGKAARQPQQISPIGTEPSKPTALVPLRSSDGKQDQTDTKQDQFDTVVFSRDGGVADQETTREFVREEATKDIQWLYALLLEDLDLTPQEREALLTVLIEDQIASTKTPYKRGETIDKEEQSIRIAAIIGDRKLQQFRELESNLGAYGESQQIASLLQNNGAPLTEPQLGGLLKILIETRDNHAATPPPADVEPGSIESLERQVAQMADRERHIMELAPSVLSAKQVVYLDEQYQFLSYRRVNAVERQRQERADGTGPEDSPLSFPAWVGN